MGDFFSDPQNGPVILLIILVVDVAVVLGGLWLVLRFIGGRIVKRSTHILRLAAEGDKATARALLEEWDRGDRPRAALARVNIAKAWLAVDEPTRAMRVLETTSISKSRRCLPLRRLAAHVRYDTLKALGEDDRAEWFRRDERAKDPTAPWLATSEWLSAYQEGDSDRAAAALTGVWSALARHPKDEVALAVLAQDAFTAHRYSQGADLLEQLIHRLDRPGSRRLSWPDAYLFLGTARLASGDDAAAEDAFRAFVKTSPKPEDAEIRVRQAKPDALLVGGRPTEASVMYERLTTGEDSAAAYAGLANCSIRLGEPQRAAQQLDRAEDLGYVSRDAKLLRAQILVDLGEVADADRLAHEEAAARPPSDPGALYTLAYVGVIGELPYAEEALRRYIELRIEDPDLPPLLDRPAPDGRTWRDRISIAARPDL